MGKETCASVVTSNLEVELAGNLAERINMLMLQNGVKDVRLGARPFADLLILGIH